jgi:hypothetical protein
MRLVERVRDRAPSPGANPPDGSDAKRAGALWAAANLAAGGGARAAALAALEASFAAGFATPSRVLCEPAFASHLADRPTRTKLRALLGAFACESTATLVRADEPGDRLTLGARLVDPTGAPIAARRIYLYHTDSSGIYDPEVDSDNPRLFGWFVTDADGRFQVETIVPAGYPDSNVLPHVHYRIDEDGAPRIGGEIVFDGAGLSPGSPRARDSLDAVAAVHRVEAGRFEGRVKIVTPR